MSTETETKQAHRRFRVFGGVAPLEGFPCGWRVAEVQIGRKWVRVRETGRAAHRRVVKCRRDAWDAKQFEEVPT